MVAGVVAGDFVAMTASMSPPMVESSSAPRTDRPDDLSNARLLRLTHIAVGTIVAWFLLRGFLPEAWRTPGSPQLYLTGVAGAALLPDSAFMA